MVKVSETIAERARQRRAMSQEQASRVMDRLAGIARTRLEEAAAELRRAFGNQGLTVNALVRPDEPDKRDRWSWQIIKTARREEYYADLSRARRWVSLSLKIPDLEERDTRFVVSVHAVGRAADLHAATAFLTWPLGAGDGYDSGRWHCEVVDAPRYRVGVETTNTAVAEERFRSWLEETIENGLGAWGEAL